ncbi:hypothetical protein KMW28_09195 [Flammeovirga yaeyamensis]|uniref:Uncharacterized protein n=1 Tax=Flammeovirga yaeyamensis TaxID=367791 RepID=A0AAX1N896_9BACT|nr:MULTISPECIES: hypothetical protein [Flammeovirga]ANQ48786.1 hypothetical protein MY04_1410 [Flammeovirga sp. MY04]MBB3698866.1 hypothetical protein [Flammeovirga yaeyamensis]NMF37451.1 hypothetical protein [Flammeovirga yaeyamensis]QWG03736.1 hypothetical protein KMW28_09195 [Flammeovirga yaeyamensis]
MKLIELIVSGIQIDLILIDGRSQIATERFLALVDSDIFLGWKVIYVAEDKFIKIGPVSDDVSYNKRPVTRVDYDAPLHKNGMLSFIGQAADHVSDHLMFVLDNNIGVNYDGICAPIATLTVDHYMKLKMLEEGMSIEEIRIKDVEKSELLGRIPTFI